MPWLWVISLSPHLLFIVSYHNEYTHFCREMCNIVNTRFLRPFGVITEITTKSPQKLYNGSFFGPFFTQKSFFSHWKVFDLKSLKQDFIYGSTVFIFRVPIFSVSVTPAYALNYINCWFGSHFLTRRSLKLSHSALVIFNDEHWPSD